MLVLSAIGGILAAAFRAWFEGCALYAHAERGVTPDVFDR